MENKFEIINIRYKLDDPHILLVSGWFQNNKKDLADVRFCADGKELKVEEEEISNLYVMSKNLSPKQDIDTMYFYWVKLPLDFSDKKLLTVQRIEANKLHKIREYKVKDLMALKKGMAGNVDFSGIENGQAVIRGWFAFPAQARLKVCNMSGQELQIDMKQKTRRDVLNEFPEAVSENVLGYEICLPNYKGKKVNLIASCNGKKYTKECKLYYTSIEKIAGKTLNLERKAIAYYKNNGTKDTLIRVYEKLTGKTNSNYERWRLTHSITKEELQEQKDKIFEYAPKISIVIPLYKTPIEYLKQLIECIQNQTYENWELCFSDGTGHETGLRKVVETYRQKDSRIKITCSDKPLQISDNTNAAIEIATGEFIAFADHDDLLAPNAFFENIKMLNEKPELEFIYSDEDKISMDGKEYFEPHFKPDFNLDLLRTTNYICHFVVAKKELVESVGGLHSQYDGAQDYDFVLRCMEKTTKVYHIPQVLYHWRAHKDSTAENPQSKMYAFENGEKAVQSHFNRLGIHATVKMRKDFLGIYRSIYHLDSEPLVSIIIPNKDHVDDLNKCICSIEEKSAYHNIEYIIVENNSVLKSTFDYYDKLCGENNKVKVVTWKDEFNYSAINNYGVTFAKGEYLLFLNNDTEIINEECISELLGYCMREEVGVVGARLYYPDDTIQHAGVIIGLGGIAGHAFANMPKEGPGYFARPFCAQDYSAVTAACMMVKKKVFEEVNGFNKDIKVAFNDVDFCLRVRELGKLVVYNPYAELYHYESKSRGLDDTEEKATRFNGEVEYMQQRWKDILMSGDPYYNPNLSLIKGDFSLR